MVTKVQKPGLYDLTYEEKKLLIEPRKAEVVNRLNDISITWPRSSKTALRYIRKALRRIEEILAA